MLLLVLASLSASGKYSPGFKVSIHTMVYEV
jgi:hypothetical protein